MRTLVTAAACLLAGFGAGNAEAQDRTAYLAPQVAEPVNTPRPLAETPKSTEERYAPTRDYRREKVDMILRVYGEAANQSENAHPMFRSLVGNVQGFVWYALEASPVRKDAKEAGSAYSWDEMLWAAAGQRPDVPAELAAEARRAIRQFRTSVIADQLDVLAIRTCFVPPIETADPLLAVSLPHLGEARDAARLNAARMLIADLDGDEREFVRAAVHNFGLSRAVASEAILVSQYVSVAIDAITFQKMIECELRGTMKPAVCREMLGVLDTYPGPDWSRSIRGEGLNSLDSLHWIYTKGSISALDLSISKAEAAASRLLWASRESMLETADGYYEAASKVFDDDLAVATEARKTVAELDAKVQETVFRAKFRPLALMMPAMEQSIRVESQIRGLRGAVRIMLAAELFKADRGEYPLEAEELVPGYLPSLPTDWFTIDRAPLRYVRVDPVKDRLGRSFLVYSVGLDGEDHGGKEDARSNYAATQSPSYKGLDLVYNWREAPEQDK